MREGSNAPLVTMSRRTAARGHHRHLHEWHLLPSARTLDRVVIDEGEAIEPELSVFAISGARSSCLPSSRGNGEVFLQQHLGVLRESATRHRFVVLLAMARTNHAAAVRGPRAGAARRLARGASVAELDPAMPSSPMTPPRHRVVEVEHQRAARLARIRG